MVKKKLTLFMPEDVIEKAHRLAKSRSISVSEMLARYVVASTALQDEPPSPELDENRFDPATARMLELARNGIRLPHDWNYKEDLMEILEEKYGK